MEKKAKKSVKRDKEVKEAKEPAVEINISKESKKPKDPIVLVGFPGFGLVGVIATEFLIDHLKTKEIGKYWFEDLPATIAIHDGEVINPVSVFYDEQHNIVVIHSISGANGIEWKAADLILRIARDFNAKEIICLEGVGSAKMSEMLDGEMTTTTLGESSGELSSKVGAFFHSTSQANKKKLKETGTEQLKESIVMGPSAAIILKSDIPVTTIFAETSTNLPDSKAAAKIVEILDKYLNLDIDFKPLLEMAKKFENKLKKIMEQSKEIQTQQEQKNLSYVG